MATPNSEQEQLATGRTNYARISYASLIIIPKLLQEWLFYLERPEHLLKDCASVWRFLSSTEKNSVHDAKQFGYDNFDIPLIYKLLRNLPLKGLRFERPTNGWDFPRDPSPTDITDGDDLERCRRTRNKIIHRGNADVTKKEMETYFISFKGVARRLEKKLKKGYGVFQKQLQDLETCSMDEVKEKEYKAEIDRHRANIGQLKGTIEILSSPVDDMVQFISSDSEQKYVVGEKVTMECLATGENTKAVWYKEEDLLPSDAIVECKNLALRLIIPEVTLQHRGTYTVKIGTASCEIKLDVIEKVSSLKLRNYQKELAEIASAGENTIVCAGRNAGKTHVAFYVIENHLLKHENGKVVFINRTNVLLEQQYRRACEVLTSLHDQDKIYKLEAGKDPDKNFMERLEKTRLLFLTPTSLSNRLGGDQGSKVSISDFTLLVFDECHHTYGKDLYNDVMKYYRIEKFHRKSGKLPQILGLTASPGTNRSSNEISGMFHLKALMANLSVSKLSIVRKHKDDLLAYSATPVKVSIQSQSRGNDPVKRILLAAITYVENIFCRPIVTTFLIKHMKEATNLSNALMKPPVDKTDARYIQWMAETRDKIEKIPHKDPDVPRLLHACIRHLELYAECLEVNALLEIDQVRDVFSDRYGLLLYEGQAARTEEERTIVSKLQDVHAQIFELGRNLEGNPDITEIINKLKEEYDKLKENSRFLIFVKTRATAKALAERLPDNLKSAHLTGSDASKSEGGVPRNEQLEVVKKFRDGYHLCIVATTVGCEGLDIQKCNLVIRYRFHADKISNLQMRGRIRQKGGKEILLASEQDVERETQNIERQYLMQKAIEQVSNQDLVREICILEKEVFDAEETERRKREMKINRKKKGAFIVKCKPCGVDISDDKVMEFRQLKQDLNDPIQGRKDEYLSDIFKNTSLRPLAKDVKPWSKGFKYDFFVCHSNKDADWVKNILLTHLESTFDEHDIAFKGCIADRDFIPGKSVVDNIIEAITQSNKVILILTPDFVKSNWCDYEATLAICKSLDSDRSNNRNFVIPIILKDCKIPTKLVGINYLDMTSQADLRREIFRLKKAL